MAPYTFASAAAGNNASSRPENTGVEWSRRANGATQTFRRPSLATSTSASAHQCDGSAASNTGVYIPPHATRNGAVAESSKFSRDQLLALYGKQKASGHFDASLQDLYIGDWDPPTSNGASVVSWGKKDHRHAKDAQPGAELCWEPNGSTVPLGLTDMDDDERELFTSSVNSTIKPPQPPGAKDGTPKESLSLRKSSMPVAQNSPGGYGLASPTSVRPGGRRRETSDAYPFPRDAGEKPTASRYSKDESNAAVPPPALLRRRAEFKEGAPAGSEEQDKEKKDGEPFPGLAGLGSMKRSMTAGSTAVNGPSSPWSATTPTSTLSPMGAFTNFGHASQASDKRPTFGSLRSESRFKGLMTKDVQDSSHKEVEEKPSLSKLTESSEAEGSQGQGPWADSRNSQPLSDDFDYSQGDFAPGSASLHSAATATGTGYTPPRYRGLPGTATPQRSGQTNDASFSTFGMTESTAFSNPLSGRNESFPHQTPIQRSADAGNEPMSPTATNPYQNPEQRFRAEEDDDADALGSRGRPNFGFEPNSAPLPGLGTAGPPRTGPARFDMNTSDRSQSSSTGPGRGLGSLSSIGGFAGLGNPSAWALQTGSMGMSAQDRGATLETSHADMGSLQSPGIGSFAKTTLAGGIGALPLGASQTRSGKMSSMFSSALPSEVGMDAINRHPELFSGFGSGRGNFSAASASSIPARDDEGPLRGVRAPFEDGQLPFGGLSGDFGKLSGLPTSAALHTPTAAPSQPPIGAQAPNRQSTSSSASNPLQKRTMVMPDRMRWVYKDPQGAQQGPWSGLEMHEWYRGGFFSPDLQVKKEEDAEYEPLAHLIRRIGNSREPFLVPQIGIPHGPDPAASQPGNAWAGNAIGGPGVPGGIGAVAGGGAQPPFAGSFPSFGTTLTAEQQNNLERRKQEEQYLMARQKEHLAQQQMIAKQISFPGIGAAGGNLQHQISTHSLHSQPSYGSITSPGGFLQSPAHAANSAGPGPLPGFFDGAGAPTGFRGQPGIMGSEMGGALMQQGQQQDDMPNFMDRMTLRSKQNQNQNVTGAGPQYPFQNQSSHGDLYAQQQLQQAQAQAQAQEDRMRLQREQHEFDQMQHRSLAAGNGQLAGQEAAQRFEEFHSLRNQVQQQQQQHPQAGSLRGQEPQQTDADLREEGRMERQRQQLLEIQREGMLQQELEHQHRLELQRERQQQQQQQQLERGMSLTEQVQRAQSEKHQRQLEEQQPRQLSWAKIDTHVPVQPFPAPPTSSSPMPAPVAQRKQNLADHLNADSRSQSQTPSLDTPSASIAPWAKEASEHHQSKGPSLKQIQEAEAKTAAAKEAAESAARRALAEREMQAAANAPVAAPGLPSGANWAAAGSPSSAASGNAGSPWSKPGLAGGKMAPVPSALKIKTMAQIQKEEEARKARASQAAAAANASAAAPSSLSSVMGPGGKRYAELAKGGPGPGQGATPSATGSAWTTVGASGKTKAPVSVAGPVVGTGAATRTAGTANVPVKTAAGAVGKMKVGPPVKAKLDVQEELKKWMTGELRVHVRRDVVLDDIVMLITTTPERNEVMDIVHPSTITTYDTGRFVEELMRRRKLADKGMVDTTSSASPVAGKKAGEREWIVQGKGGRTVKEHANGVDYVGECDAAEQPSVGNADGTQDKRNGGATDQSLDAPEDEDADDGFARMVAKERRGDHGSSGGVSSSLASATDCSISKPGSSPALAAKKSKTKKTKKTPTTTIKRDAGGPKKDEDLGNAFGALYTQPKRNV